MGLRCGDEAPGWPLYRQSRDRPFSPISLERAVELLVDQVRRTLSGRGPAGLAMDGSDGPPCCSDDLHLADTVLLIGTNTPECHPVLFEQLLKRKRKQKQALLHGIGHLQPDLPAARTQGRGGDDRAGNGPMTAKDIPPGSPLRSLVHLPRMSRSRSSTTPV